MSRIISLFVCLFDTQQQNDLIENGIASHSKNDDQNDLFTITMLNDNPGQATTNMLIQGEQLAKEFSIELLDSSTELSSSIFDQPVVIHITPAETQQIIS